MNIRLRCFSHIKYALGRDEMTIELPGGATAGDLIARVRAMGGETLRTIPVRAAVNQAYVDPGEVLHDGDEVALIPPVQGG
ncbi:MAG: MoaD/ThiS family protein [Deltaproteobacteria bacterium]|nr:MoaD/ThiS family protein [Deltaproteobacteria bacterium]